MTRWEYIRLLFLILRELYNPVSYWRRTPIVMQKISCLRCCVFSVLVSGLLKAQFEATSVYNPNSRPIFSLDVETRHAQYFTYSPVVASGKMVFPLHLLPSLKLQEYFYACITSACMRIARQPIELMPETVCSNANTLHRTDLQSFICNNRDDLIDDHGRWRRACPGGCFVW